MRIRVGLFALSLTLVLVTACQSGGGPIEPVPTRHTLTVEKDGSGSGTVTSVPAGIACGEDCSENFNEGTSVTLTATPASGSTFAGWSGACSGTGTCTVVMNGPREVTASFTPASGPAEVVATTGGDEPVATHRLLPGEAVVFAVSVPSERQAALFLEVDAGGLAIEVFNPDTSFFAESISPEFFQGEDRTQAAASEHLTTQAVITPTQCRGACVIRRTRAQGETVFVRIENTTSSPITFNLYAYTREFDDNNEPVNNRREDAISFDRTASGALETLEDQDWFAVSRTGTLYFQAGSAIGHRTAVFSPGAISPRDIIEPGNPVSVSAGDLLQVYADPELNRAGPASTSRYSFEVQ